MKSKETIPHWDDIIFENRNKKYGAYELRSHYNSRLAKAFFITLACSSLIFLLIHHSKRSDMHETFETSRDSIVFSTFSTEIITEKQNFPRHDFNKALTTRPDDNSYQAVSDTTAKADDKPNENFGTTNDTTTGESIGNATDSSSFGRQGIQGQDTFSVAGVDKQPEFPGGIESFYKYLTRRLHYNEEARRAGLSKRSYVSFVINEEGLIVDVAILNNIGFGLDEEVRNVLFNSPKWSPGFVRNEAVKTKIILPVNFKLSQY